MHTFLVLTSGLALLVVFLVLARALRASTAAAAMAFVPVWFLAAAANMWIGVTRAGYSTAEEFPIFLMVFGVPAIIAMTVWWKNARL